MKKQNYFFPIILFLFTCLLLYLSMPDSEQYYGSQTDWLSQHVQIAQHFREQFYESGQLIGNYSWLGAGSNIYMFSYYGLLRPDVLLSFVLPMYSVQDVLIAYAILSMLVSIQLCYLFLRKKDCDPFTALLTSMLFACCTCFFQTHRQLMFINYMPFLFLMLIGIDKMLQENRKALLIISFFFLFLHSFYFSLSGFVVGFLYLLNQSKDKKRWLTYFFCVGWSAAMAAILLLPTAWTILEHKKDSGASNSFNEIFALNTSFTSLLYSPYGIGATLIVLYTLLCSFTNKKRRMMAAMILASMFFSIVPFLLNATLYTRTKVLIPFLPLVLLLTAQTLQDLFYRPQKKDLLLLLLCFLPLGKQMTFLHFLDWLLLALGIGLCHLFPRFAKQSIWICMIMPVILFLDSAAQESFPSRKELQNPFTKEELHDFYDEDSYRFDRFDQPLNSVNETLVAEKQTTMYSSTMNTLYSQYYYDTIKNPIRIKNRVALLASNNPFHAYLLGVRYVQTNIQNVPYGYEIMQQKDNHVLAQNQNVLPLAYASSALYDAKAFANLPFPYQLDTLSNRSIVNQNVLSSYTSKIQPFSIEHDPVTLPQHVTSTSIANGWKLDVKQETTFSIPIQKMQNHDILIMRFHVEQEQGKEVTITINNIRNRLSSKQANYPNDNHDFTYMLSAHTSWDALHITLSKGVYTITDMETYKMDANQIKLPDYTALQPQKTEKQQLINGWIDWEKDGYLITSLPYQHGYEATVDGKPVEIEVVNTAFVGFPLQAGKHEIIISFTPPLKQIGMAISATSSFLFLCMLHQERRFHAKRNSNRIG